MSYIIKEFQDGSIGFYCEIKCPECGDKLRVSHSITKAKMDHYIELFQMKPESQYLKDWTDRNVVTVWTSHIPDLSIW